MLLTSSLTASRLSSLIWGGSHTPHLPVPAAGWWLLTWLQPQNPVYNKPVAASYIKGLKNQMNPAKESVWKTAPTLEGRKTPSPHRRSLTNSMTWSNNMVDWRRDEYLTLTHPQQKDQAVRLLSLQTLLKRDNLLHLKCISAAVYSRWSDLGPATKDQRTIQGVEWAKVFSEVCVEVMAFVRRPAKGLSWAWSHTVTRIDSADFWAHGRKS